MKTRLLNWLALGSLVTALVVLAVPSARTAITEIGGLAVAQTGTLWNNVKDAAAGDNLVDGVIASALMLYDGGNFDRARGDITNGLDVDVTRTPGGAQTPADAFANPTTFQGTWSLIGLFNNTTWDRWRGQNYPAQGPTILNATATAAANTSVIVTLTGVAGQRIHLYKIAQLSCLGPGAASFFTVNDGTTLYSILTGQIPSSPITLEEQWSPGLTAATGANMVITLTGCGAGTSGFFTYTADRY